MISSVANPQIAQALRLRGRIRRARTGLVIVEGARALRAALAAGALAEVFHTTAGGRRRSALLDDVRVYGASTREVSDDVMGALTSTVSTPDIAGIASLRFGDAGILRDARWPAVLLSGVHDPEAAGTILAAAVGFGVHVAIQGGSTVDLGDPRVVRTAAGAHFTLRLGRSASDAAALTVARQAGGEVVILDADGPAIWDSDLPDAMMLLVQGTQGDGTVMNDGIRVSVPSCTPLPLVATTSVVLHEWARRRVAVSG